MSRNDFPRALHDLEQQFAELAPQIPEGAEKQALSVLHGIVMEVWRGIERDRVPAAGVSTRDIADLWQGAPAMEGEAVNQPLAVGTQAPDFALPDASGNTVRLSDFRGRPVVLVFYPLDWSPGCSQQLALYEQESDQFAARDAQVLGISVDSIYSHGAWAAVRGLSIPLLSDFNPKGEVARRYQVWRDGDGFSERALYVVDPQGRISYNHVSPYLHHIPDIYELLEAVDAARADQTARLTA
ncbi:peroxiredoxin [Mycobacterium avium]|uniref:peroxiredoxin n=1 Tax=Mycobacterium avium TaxID=1764 RepID=UPI0009FD94CB|nr:peroxiredoxin [Mycobacterium avium]